MSLVHVLVRYHEIIFLMDQITVQENINIDGPWLLVCIRKPPQFVLNLFREHEKLTWRHARRHVDHHIEVERLLPDAIGYALVDTRLLDEIDVARERTQRRLQMREAITQV